MFKLRETWNEVFPATKLYQLDIKVNRIDPAWPIQNNANIHVNPDFLKKVRPVLWFFR
jgi:pre-mRNA cleavage complex 2 protein Pcf11